MAILGDSHLDQLNVALNQLKEAQQELALAKRAGFNQQIGGKSLADLEAQINDLQGRLIQVKQTYFPNHP